MTYDVIPEDLKQFLLKNIDSIAQWEGLLLLRANRENEWTAEMVAKNLYLNETDTQKLLDLLTARGFLTTFKKKQHITYTYQPNSEELDELTDRTAELYKNYLIPVTHFIHSKPKTRIQEFANAFRIRKD